MFTFYGERCTLPFYQERGSVVDLALVARIKGLKL
jgi:hypothetical protein